ncbi:hypothetical protein [Actinomyces vulturis]|uniref:hypothetical protein n=1 Tax=Actinomyces vulturis TaxID=1857645 RepID=UPI0011461D23|nr:hypothetical protein [Actinomyces vulturis]
MSGPVNKFFDILRNYKHTLFVYKKRTVFEFAFRTENIYRKFYRYFPYNYDPSDFKGLDVVDSISNTSPQVQVPKRIFVCWTGDNELRGKRLDCFRSIQDSQTVEVILVDNSNLCEWILPDHPLPDLYWKLHFVHRADFLRGYLMNFHGGGYADIKGISQDWGEVFANFDDPDVWLAGYKNPCRLMTPNFPDKKLTRLMIRTSAIRVGQAGFIARAHTPLTEEWYRNMNRILDRNRAALLSNEIISSRSGGPSYPLHWNGLLAQVWDPLVVKYSEHVRYSETLFPAQDNYRDDDE